MGGALGDAIRLMRIAFLVVFTMAAVISFAADEHEAARAWRRQSLATWSSKHILFVVSAGNGHWLDIFIFGNDRQKKNPVGQLRELPEGGGICHEQMLAYPTAYARMQGDIVVQMPTGAAWIRDTKTILTPLIQSRLG
jgi:hypothetical protein